MRRVYGGETEYAVQLTLPGYTVAPDPHTLADVIVQAYPHHTEPPEGIHALLEGKLVQHWKGVTPKFDPTEERPNASFISLADVISAAEDVIEIPTWGQHGTSLRIDEGLLRISERQRHAQQRNDRFLLTGDRFYVDHGHPELSIPEVTSVHDVVRYVKAAELRVNLARRNAQEAIQHLRMPTADLSGVRLSVYGNNHDFGGHAYGTHENYLVDRSRITPDRLVRGVMPFLVSRIYMTGLGSLGTSDINRFSISQRALFTETLIGAQTTHDRPIFNTRDEPHADDARYLRLHVIAGDANHAEWAMYLKHGTMGILLRMIEDDALDTDAFVLRDPVHAMRAWSYDWRGKHAWPLERGGTVTAREHLAMYVDAMGTYLATHGATDEEQDILDRFSHVVEGLADPMGMVGYLDWPTQFSIIDSMVSSGKLTAQDPRLKNLSLQYCDVDPATSLYARLLHKGKMRRVVTDNDVLDAFAHPPSGTRAYLRGTMLAQYADALTGMNWSRFSTDTAVCTVMEPTAGSKEHVDGIGAQSLTDLLKGLAQMPGITIDWQRGSPHQRWKYVRGLLPSGI